MICCARLSRWMPSRVKTCTSMTVPLMPDGTRSDVSFTSEAFSPKIARSSFSSGVSWVSPFGVTLPTSTSPASTSAPMYTMPDSSRRPSCIFGQVRDVARDFFRSELRIASNDVQFFDVDRGVTVVCDNLLRDQDRVFEVVAVPRHERDQHVLAQGQFAEVGRCAVSQHVATRTRCRRPSRSGAG